MFHAEEIEGGGDSTGCQDVGGHHDHVHLVGDADTPTEKSLQGTIISQLVSQCL